MHVESVIYYGNVEIRGDKYMAKRKTQYIIDYNADVQIVNATIQNWLSANGFIFYEKDGLKAYRAGDMFSGYRFFEYYFQGNKLLIYAYLKSMKKPFPLDNKFVGIAVTVPYVNKIEELANAINYLSMQNSVLQQSNTTGLNNQVGNVYGTSTFSEKKEKQSVTCAKTALYFGISSLVVAISGFWITVLCIFMGYYMGYLGLNSTKQNTAVVGMIINTIGLLLLILVMAGIISPLV